MFITIISSDDMWFFCRFAERMASKEGHTIPVLRRCFRKMHIQNYGHKCAHIRALFYAHNIYAHLCAIYAHLQMFPPCFFRDIEWCLFMRHECAFSNVHFHVLLWTSNYAYLCAMNAHFLMWRGTTFLKRLFRENSSCFFFVIFIDRIDLRLMKTLPKIIFSYFAKSNLQL